MYTDIHLYIVNQFNTNKKESPIWGTVRGERLYSLQTAKLD